MRVKRKSALIILSLVALLLASIALVQDRPATGPRIVLSPLFGYSAIRVAGTGFGANQPITIRYDVLIMPTVPSNLTTDSSGSFTAIIYCPNPTFVGQHVISAYETNNPAVRAVAIFTVISMTRS